VNQNVYIGLGSNLENPKQQIKHAVDELRCLPDSRYIEDSGLYFSRPMGPENQPDYYNAVALIETQMEPLVLLDYLQAIESKLGRVRTQRWGPRVIDLDILLYGDRQISSHRLQVPHPGLNEREFVLYPLLKLCATLDIPGHGKLQQVIKQCPERGLKYLGIVE